MRCVINFWWFFVVLEYSLSSVSIFVTFVIPGSRDIAQVVQTVKIDLQKFCFTEQGSNLAFVLKNIAHNFYKLQKGHLIAFYKIIQETTLQRFFWGSVYFWNTFLFMHLLPGMNVMHGGGGNLPWFWVRTYGWSPRTPPHSYTWRSFKKQTHIYTSHTANCTHWYIFFLILPIYIFLSEKDTTLIWFWCENDTHSYTRRPEKYTPSSRTSVYTFIMEVTPPPRDVMLYTNCIG